ncbi:hypothetical protein FPV67DRAFT_763477 [Lyophyllum atratum]|nr:hypothetical protein FPV67DRAFT_763477 [Lyophyllum atratum]
MPALPKAVANQAPLEDLIAAQERHDQDYSTYDSPFKWYPLLASRARPLYTNSVIDPSSFLSSSSSASTSNSSSLASSSNLSFFTTPSSSSSASSLSFSPSTASVYPFHTDTAAFMLPDLRQLKLATTSKLLDPSKRICQYEVPGGGVCRDEGCEDVHLSRIAGHGRGGGAEPSDQDTVEYLLNTLPSGWLADNGVSHSKMSSAFQQVRLKNSQMGFEERVANILAALGPPLPP